MDKYRLLGKKGEGTFSEVLKCQNTRDGTYWACKKMKQQYSSADQIKEIREIQALRHLSGNLNILKLHEVIFEKRSGTLCLIFELMDMNIYELIRSQRTYMSTEKISRFMYQLLRAVEHMHKHGYFHRDIKPENILIKDDVLKLADFGSCRRIHSKHPFTEYISTRWYRAPECLLTDGYYSFEMDIWSVGCVMFEISTLHPLFPGANEIDQIDKIHDVLGTPDPALLEKFKNKSRTMRFDFKPKRGVGLNRLLKTATHDVVDLITHLCTYDPDQRISAHKALKHPYFDVIRKDALEKEKAVALKEADAERVLKTSEDKYNSDDDAASRIDAMSIPASEPYKSQKKKEKKRVYILWDHDRRAPEFTNIQRKSKSFKSSTKPLSNVSSYPHSQSNSVLSHYSAATTLGIPITQTYQNNRANQNMVLPKLSGSSNALHFTSFPSPTFQSMYSTISDPTSLPTLFNTNILQTQLNGSQSKNSKTIYKSYFPDVGGSNKKSTFYS